MIEQKWFSILFRFRGTCTCSRTASCAGCRVWDGQCRWWGRTPGSDPGPERCRLGRSVSSQGLSSGHSGITSVLVQYPLFMNHTWTKVHEPGWLMNPVHEQSIARKCSEKYICFDFVDFLSINCPEVLHFFRNFDTSVFKNRHEPGSWTCSWTGSQKLFSVYEISGNKFYEISGL